RLGRGRGHKGDFHGAGWAPATLSSSNGKEPKGSGQGQTPLLLPVCFKVVVGTKYSRYEDERGLKMAVPKIVVKPGEGRSVWPGGMGVVFKVSGAPHGENRT